jgi:hypothetical protein
MKLYNYKNASVTFEKSHAGRYFVLLRIGTEVKDKILCDNYKTAREYCRAFCKIAKHA